jgi:hypothetical protein
MSFRENAHVVHFQQAFDPRSVCDYVGGSLAQGQSAIVIAAPAHAKSIQAGLAWDARSKTAARVSFIDAEEAADGLADPGAKAEKTWQKRMGAFLETAAASSPRGQIVVYTETPGLLWKRKRRASALQVERLWTGVRMRYAATVVCGYAVDPLDCHQAAFDVVELHDVARAFDDEPRLKRYEKAVELALREQAAMVRSLVAEDRRLRDMPFGQAAMIWLCRHMPKMAEKVAAAARH